MCAMLIAEPAGKPVRFTVNVAVAAVTLPAPSFVVSSTIVAVPATVPSGPETGGTSFAGDSVAVNVGFVGDGAVVDELPQPAANSPSAAASKDKRFMVRLLVIRKTFGPG